LSAAHHLFDDATNPPRDRAWYHAQLDGHWLWNVGPNSDIGALATLGSRWLTNPEPAGLFGSAGLQLRIQHAETLFDFWLGAGLVSTSQLGELSTAKWAPIGGIALEFSREVFSIVIRMSLTAARRPSGLGRLNYAGFVDSAAFELGFAIDETLREAMRIRVFGERATDPESRQLGWAGASVSIPIAAVGIDQELAYESRFLVVQDSSRFGNGLEVVLQNLLVAGLRF
ncbi:MAG: hypothetical protein KC561_15965, partial [Myxococcales bacterium]|nr:hypothetical protein [Myxococcales bacterium]